MIGEVFNRLTVLEEYKEGGRKIYVCSCSCGTARKVHARRDNLLSGGVRSCGCLRNEILVARSLRHGHAGKNGGNGRSPEYTVWHNMIQRCTNCRNGCYRDYGGRGITVCERWKKFENFLADMGERPEGMTLDRKDNDGPYSPDNCKWSTKSEQNGNRRTKKVMMWGSRGRRTRKGLDPVKRHKDKLAWM